MLKLFFGKGKSYCREEENNVVTFEKEGFFTNRSMKSQKNSLSSDYGKALL